MKIEQYVLKNGLSTLSMFVSKKNTSLPILMHAKLEVGDNLLTMVSTDLEAFGIISVPCITEKDEDWETTVPFTLFNDYVSSLNGEIDIKKNKTSITIQCGKTKFVPKTIDAVEYPITPELPDVTPLDFDCDELVAQLSSVVFAAATDENRPILTGVYLRSDGDSLVAVTADGFRMAVYTVKRKGDAFSLVIPSAFISSLLRIISKSEHKLVRVYTTNTQAFFVLDDAMFVTQLIEGNFPDYNQIMPKSHIVRAVVNKDEMVKEVNRMAIIASQSNNILSLEFTTDQIKLEADTVDVGDCEGFVKAEVETEEFYATAANWKFLHDALMVMSGKVVIEQDGKARPLKLYPENNEANCQVVMPMFIKS